MKSLRLLLTACLAMTPLWVMPSAEAAGRMSTWVDRSHAIFFSPALKETAGVQQSFPIFWWNFLVLEGDYPKPAELCAQLKILAPKFILRAECGQSLSDLKPILDAWSGDQSLRKDRPAPPVLQTALNQALAKASLPSPDNSLTLILRNDPLESWRDFQKLVEQRLKIPFPRQQGFFTDPVTHRIIIPLQMAFTPSETLKTANFLSALKTANLSEGTYLIGAHGSTLRNEQQITLDTSVASKVGLIVLALLGAVLFLTGRSRLLWIVPIVLVSIGLSALLIILIHGSIHGLTLSFGTGLIGLAVDYGLYAALGTGSKKAWKANFFGLLTTLSGLLVLRMSSIPLFQQMMLFASIGLVIAFTLLYFFIQRFRSRFQAQPFPFKISTSLPQKVLTLTLLGFLIVGVFILRPDLDMKQFDFQDPATQTISTWLYHSMEMTAPLFGVQDSPRALEEANSEKKWADSQGIRFENLSRYLPPVEEQNHHLQTWTAQTCEQSHQRLTADQRTFFEPFIQSQFCRLDRKALSISAEPTDRLYLKHLQGSGRWLTLWLPSNDEQDRKIREKFPSVHSLKDMVMSFPQTLARELSWMTPLSMLIMMSLLFLYYRNLKLTLVAVVPFFSALGLITAATWLFGLHVSFISLIGWIMVFGFSIDYGIFVTNIYAQPKNSEKSSETPATVWSTISLAAFSNLAGFAPLLFCRHPVLRHLGQALFLGTLGTYFGTICGIPALMERKQSREIASS